MLVQLRTFFHYDQGQRLSEGLVISPDPTGLSQFGRIYASRFRALGLTLESLPRGDFYGLDEDARREGYVEQVRRKAAKQGLQAASRFACFFAADNIDGAQAIANRMMKPSGLPIFEVFTEAPFTRHDMTWLDFNFPRDRDARSYNYERYWAGKSIADPAERPPECPDDHASLYEVLINGSVTVGRRVGTT